jgi:hypothetical protein
MLDPSTKLCARYSRTVCHKTRRERLPVPYGRAIVQMPPN